MVTAVSTDPIRPPTPWMPNTSERVVRAVRLQPRHDDAADDTRDSASKIAPKGPELPAAGVTATRPAIAPNRRRAATPYGRARAR